jgi:hypothetical protein
MVGLFLYSTPASAWKDLALRILAPCVLQRQTAVKVKDEDAFDNPIAVGYLERVVDRQASLA